MSKQFKTNVYRKYPNNKSPVGYCHSRVHKGYLTLKAVKDHKCLERNCKNFQKLDCQYWRNVLKSRMERKLAKFFRKHYVGYAGGLDGFIEDCKKYYGGYESIPVDENGSLDICDFLEENKIMHQ